MRKSYIGIGLLLTGILPLTQAKAASGNTSKKPNVVFILSDDLGWSDLGCYGSRFYETPHIDMLARQGVRFTKAYAACHVSSPSRASILTGQYPARLGLTDWLPGRKNFPFQKLKNVVTMQHLPYGENNTFPAVMKANGYKTAIIGKWHLGEDPASCEQQGFDLHIPSGWLQGWPAKSYFSPYQMPGLKDGPDGEYLTDRITDEAINFMVENKDTTFLLYISHYAVHDPIEGKPDLVKKYQQKLKQMGPMKGIPYILEGDPDNPTLDSENENEGFKILPNRMVKIKQLQDNVQFAAMVESLDQSVGRILDKLKELGLEENTIVIFYSDNGGMSAANFGNPNRVIQPDKVDKAYSTSNLPLRGGKGWLYEGGIRVPMIVKFPENGRKGTVCDVPVISVDFFPTILDILGLTAENKITDGISIVPLLDKTKKAGSDLLKRPLYWHFPHYSNHGMQSPGGAIIYENYKLIEYFENNTVQLFNLKNDCEELTDLAGKLPKKADQLRSMLHAWRKSVNAQMMEPNPDRLPDKVTITLKELENKIKGGWAGQTIGVTFGGPTEFKYQGKIIPDTTKIPWNDNYVKWYYETYPGLYDDIYMDLTFVDVFERLGINAPVDSIANAFANAGFMLWHANQAARYNILNGIMPPESGNWKNNLHSNCIDFQIEADFAGLMSPGMINSSAGICDKVGHIMNYADGWYGGVYVAAMYSLAFVSNDIDFIVNEALKVIPVESNYYKRMSQVLSWHKRYPDDWKKTWLEIENANWEEDCPKGIDQAFNIESTVNSAYVLLGLLYGNGDFYKTMDIAARCGQDSDCNPSTCAGILGTIMGYDKIPGFLLKPLQKAEDLDFSYTTMSLNDTYRIGLKHALQMIELNKGNIAGNVVTINVQKPKAVRLEKNPADHIPIKREILREGMSDRDFEEYTFTGNGVVINGKVTGNKNKFSDYVADVDYFLDGKKIKNMKLPLDFIKRSTEVFWVFELPESKHTIEIKWINPKEGVDIVLESVIIYSGHPIQK